MVLEFYIHARVGTETYSLIYVKTIELLQVYIIILRFNLFYKWHLFPTEGSVFPESCAARVGQLGHLMCLILISQADRFKNGGNRLRRTQKGPFMDRFLWMSSNRIVISNSFIDFLIIFREPSNHHQCNTGHRRLREGNVNLYILIGRKSNLQVLFTSCQQKNQDQTRYELVMLFLIS